MNDEFVTPMNEPPTSRPADRPALCFNLVSSRLFPEEGREQTGEHQPRPRHAPGASEPKLPRTKRQHGPGRVSGSR